MELVTVAIFENSVKAHLALTKLEDEGIEASLTGVDGFRSTHSVSVNIQLLVRDEDYEQAKAIVGIDAVDHDSTPNEMSLLFVRWFFVIPSVLCFFFVVRLIFSLLLPDMAESKDLVFVFAGPLGGLAAAYWAAPKYKPLVALLTFAICTLAAWYME
jgi:hypothetical protein